MLPHIMHMHGMCDAVKDIGIHDTVKLVIHVAQNHIKGKKRSIIIHTEIIIFDNFLLVMISYVQLFIYVFVSFPDCSKETAQSPLMLVDEFTMFDNSVIIPGIS